MKIYQSLEQLSKKVVVSPPRFECGSQEKRAAARARSRYCRHVHVSRLLSRGDTHRLRHARGGSRPCSIDD